MTRATDQSGLEGAARRADPERPSVHMLPADAGEEMWAPLTAMLHRAYAGQVALGLRPLAGRQGTDVTARRCRSGETFVAELPAPDPAPQGSAASPRRLVGMILFEELEEAAFPEWFLLPEVAHFSLFAVDPGAQGRGIGAALLDAVERRARERRFTELALSMAEPDGELLEYYRRRGFRFVQHWRWPYTNYRSVILSRAVGLTSRRLGPLRTA